MQETGRSRLLRRGMARSSGPVTAHPTLEPMIVSQVRFVEPVGALFEKKLR